MFDIGFWELAFIGVIALLVFGPERLPEVARTAGLWVSRIRRFIANVKRDVEQELRSEELKRILKEPSPLNEVHEILEETRQSLDKPIAHTSSESPASNSSPSQKHQAKAAKLVDEPSPSAPNEEVPASASGSPPSAASGHDKQTAKN